MFRTSITKAIRPSTRAFSTTVRSMAEGATGATRPGGVASGDAFNKREKANEDYEIRKREQDKLAELKKKLSEQHEHLKDLEKSIDEISKKSSEKK